MLHLFSKSKLRKYYGQIALLYLVWYGAERALVEGLRTDSLYIPNTGIRISQLLSIIMVVVGVALLVYFYIKKLNNLKAVETAVDISYIKSDSKDASEEKNEFEKEGVYSDSTPKAKSTKLNGSIVDTLDDTDKKSEDEIDDILNDIKNIKM